MGAVHTLVFDKGLLYASECSGVILVKDNYLRLISCGINLLLLAFEKKFLFHSYVQVYFFLKYLTAFSKRGCSISS